MVNVYVFRDDATTPTGWSEIAAGYRDRLILLSGTVLETGGTTSHSHTVAVSAIAQSSLYSGSSYGAYGSPWRSAKTHQHVNAGTVNCSSYGHMPAYKAFRVVYRSTTDWDGSIPSGSILFRESVPAGWARTCDGESYFLLTSATAGSYATWTGHNHSLSGQTNNDNGTAQYTSEANQRIPDGNHYHTFTGQLANDYHDYKYWSCGLIKASSDVFIQRDSYALFDGDPGTNWEAVSADGNYLRISSTNSIVIGGSYTAWTHNHGGSAQITSNQPNTGGCHNISSTSGTLWNACAHTHVVTITVQNQTVQPSYVRLLLYKSLTDFGNPTTYTVTYDLDILVAKLNVDSSADADIVLKKQDIPVTLDIDALLEKLDISTSADFDILSQLRDLSAIYATDAVLKRIVDVFWSMSSRVVLRSDEEVGVDALLKQIYSRELIFDLITEKPFESQVAFDLQAKGTIPKTFTLDALLKKLSLITGLNADFLLKKVGIGTTYQMDILDKRLNLESSYALGTEIKATKTFTELIDLLVSKPFSDTYEVNADFKIVLNLLHAVDALIQKAFSQSMTADLLSRRTFTSPFLVDAEIEVALQVLETMDLLLRKTFGKTLTVDFVSKRISEASYTSDIVAWIAKDVQLIADLQARKSFSKDVSADLILKEIDSVLYDMGVLLKRLGLEASHDADLEIKIARDLASVANSIVRRSVDKDLPSDLVSKRISENSYTSDIIAKLINEVHTAADLLSRNSLNSGVSTDLIIREVTSVIYGADALIQRFDLEKSYRADVEVELIRELAEISDLLVKKTFDQDTSVDALLQKLGIAVTHQINLLNKRLSLEELYDVDVEIRAAKEILAVVDLLARKGFSEDVPLDLLLQKLGIAVSHQMDLLSQLQGIEKSYAVNFEARITKDLLEAADLLVQKMFSQALSIDLIGKLVLDSSYIVDAEIQTTKEISEVIDLIVKKGFSKNLPLDLLLQKLGVAFSHQMDLICKSIREDSYSTDAQVLIAKDLITLADLLVRKAFNEDLPADLLLQRLGLTVAHQMDLLEKRLSLDVSHSLDIEIKIANDFQVLSDLMIKKSFGIDIPTDLIMRRIFPAPYQMNMLSRGLIEIHADLDMLLASTFSQTYNADYRSRVYRAMEWEMSRKLMKYDADMIYFINGYFRLDAGNRLGYLVNVLCFGDDEFNFHADIILSDRPAKYRQIRLYPSSPGAQEGVVEFHGVSFEHIPIERRPRTYPETKPEHTEPEVHPDSFHYESSHRKNRQVKITYR